MLSKRKKILIISAMVVLLVVTGVLNIKLNSNVQTVSTTTQSDFFATYRQDRTDTRNQQILILDAIIADKTLSDEEISSAVAKKTAISDNMTMEMALESLIGAKGYKDVVVSSSDSFINVIVKSADLDEYEVAQIVDIIKAETGKDIDNIKIMSVE